MIEASPEGPDSSHIVAELEKELGARHPALAGLVDAYLTKSYAHYPVVTGLDATAKRVAPFDPPTAPAAEKSAPAPGVQ